MRRPQTSSKKLKMKPRGQKTMLKNKQKKPKTKSIKVKKMKLQTQEKTTEQVVPLKTRNHQLVTLVQMMLQPVWRRKGIDTITKNEGSLIPWTTRLFPLEQMIRIGVHLRNLINIPKMLDIQKNQKRLTNTKNTIRKIDFFKIKMQII